jgi:hypothetical protein
MDEDREEELLLHVAAGTDPLTALAALPDDEPGPPRKKLATGCLFAIIAAILAVLAIRAFR